MPNIHMQICKFNYTPTLGVRRSPQTGDRFYIEIYSNFFSGMALLMVKRQDQRVVKVAWRSIGHKNRTDVTGRKEGLNF